MRNGQNSMKGFVVCTHHNKRLKIVGMVIILAEEVPSGYKQREPPIEGSQPGESIIKKI